ncbi:hypothetical protein CTI12_AA377600 [Artemisia annua]|uniref:RRM domain-containing protein n=1 Tax=Artemisia annua TaxID=35608 RepID=A0A2U1M7B4_ARTAN|nr:hypothetical protein CTI12_AA377600 [Artemisia annua]
MGSFRSKEDDVLNISTSIFVMNFPESFTAKDLFHTCKQYGHVVDSFIPVKRSKSGKRFGFVRFINVFNVERLVNNLCTIWVDRFKLHANIARFNKASKNDKCSKFVNKDHVFKDTGINNRDTNAFGKICGVKDNGLSFANVLAGNNGSGSMESKSIPTIVLEDDCLHSRDLSKSLLGRVKEVSSLSNLKTALRNEGFTDLSIRYMGELWVLIEFTINISKDSFIKNVGAGSWFLELIQASNDFTPEGRIVWIEVEGIPFKLWSEKTFKRIAIKWGELLDIDDQEDMCFHSKRLYIYTKKSLNILEQFKIIFRGKGFWICAKEVPGWVPKFMEDSDDDNISEEGINDEIPIVHDSLSCCDDNGVEDVPETVFEEASGQKEETEPNEVNDRSVYNNGVNNGNEDILQSGRDGTNDKEGSTNNASESY